MKIKLVEHLNHKFHFFETHVLLPSYSNLTGKLSTGVFAPLPEGIGVKGNIGAKPNMVNTKLLFNFVPDLGNLFLVVFPFCWTLFLILHTHYLFYH